MGPSALLCSAVRPFIVGWGSNVSNMCFATLSQRTGFLSNRMRCCVRREAQEWADDNDLFSNIKADLGNMEAQAAAQAARVSRPPQTNELSQGAPGHGADQQQAENGVMVAGQTQGLVPAPDSFGENKFIVSNEDIEGIVAKETQVLSRKLQAKDLEVKALKRYVDDLEDELDEAQEQLEDEKKLRLAAEAELGRLQQKRLELEANEHVAEAEVSRRDLLADELAERFANNEISEAEFVRAEEELIEAQDMRRQSTEELQEVSVAVARAESAKIVAVESETKRAEEYAENKRVLAQKQAELERLMAEQQAVMTEKQAELERVTAERDVQQQRADNSQKNLNTIMERLRQKRRAAP